MKRDRFPQTNGDRAHDADTRYAQSEFFPVWPDLEAPEQSQIPAVVEHPLRNRPIMHESSASPFSRACPPPWATEGSRHGKCQCSGIVTRSHTAETQGGPPWTDVNFSQPASSPGSPAMQFLLMPMRATTAISSVRGSAPSLPPIRPSGSSTTSFRFTLAAW